MQPENSVVIGTTQDLASARTTFPSSTKEFWCLATVPELTADDVETFTWEWADSKQPWPRGWGNKEVSGQGTTRGGSRSGPIISAISGPVPPGQYRCQVKVNGQVIGIALFTVEADESRDVAVPY